MVADATVLRWVAVWMDHSRYGCMVSDAMVVWKVSGWACCGPSVVPLFCSITVMPRDESGRGRNSALWSVDSPLP